MTTIKAPYAVQAVRPSLLTGLCLITAFPPPHELFPSVDVYTQERNGKPLIPSLLVERSSLSSQKHLPQNFFGTENPSPLVQLTLLVSVKDIQALPVLPRTSIYAPHALFLKTLCLAHLPSSLPALHHPQSPLMQKGQRPWWLPVGAIL